MSNDDIINNIVMMTSLDVTHVDHRTMMLFVVTVSILVIKVMMSNMSAMIGECMTSCTTTSYIIYTSYGIS